MKKKSISVPVGIFLAILLLLPIVATAQQNSAALTAWADHLVRSPEDPPYLSLHYRLRTLYFSVDPAPRQPVVFLGDSITYGGGWSNLFPDSPVENRGIGGDTSLGLMKRLDQVIALKPAQIFLMIGTNDLCYGRPIPKIIENYRLILNRFRTELPDTQILVQSVLPFNDQIFPSRGLRTNGEIVKLNKEIEHLATEFGYRYIDLTSSFTGPDGRLPAKYTSDGLHLSDAAYLVWRDKIKHLVRANHS